GKKGTPVTWSTVMASNAGVTDVFLDGKKVKTFDGYSPETQHGQTGYSGRVTMNNIHTLKLVNTGNKNADSTQAQTFIQGFSAGGKLFLYHHSSVTYGTWQGVADKRALGGAYRVSSTPSNSDIAYTQNFSGSSYFRMITARGPSYSEHAIVIIHDAETNEVVANVNFILKNKKTRFNQAATIGTYEGKTHFAELDPEKTYYAGIYSDDGRPMVLDALVVGGHFGSSP
ncbi:MAG: hypothetical protein ACRDSJ_07135, partial [Rubrobacteraceae bacterium]